MEHITITVPALPWSFVSHFQQSIALVRCRLSQSRLLTQPVATKGVAGICTLLPSTPVLFPNHPEAEVFAILHGWAGLGERFEAGNGPKRNSSVIQIFDPV